MRHTIPAGLIEFDEGGRTVWVQGINGTILRIQATGKVVVNRECENSCSHSDVVVNGDIEICLVPDEVVDKSGLGLPRHDDLDNPPDYETLRDDYWTLWDSLTNNL